MSTDYQKITQALKYLATKCGRGTFNRMKAIKLLYLADRYHLRKYGRPLARDNYCAMKLGPVGSVAKDLLMSDSDFLDDDPKSYAKQHLKRVGEHEFQPLGDVDRDAFSETDFEALDFAIAHFGQYDKWTLAELTHVFPEWKKHERDVKELETSVPIRYEDFFDDPSPDDPMVKQFFPEGDLFKRASSETARDIFREWDEKANLWK